MSATRTFLFTDIEGSTGRWQADRVAMSNDLMVHDAALREVVERARGRVFKHTGDGIGAVFDTADAATAAAVAGQRALRDADWHGRAPLAVRMAVHTGVAEEREDDFFGPAINRAARLMSAGHGGQVLCSQVTAELLAEQPPQGLRLVDLGVHRLRDLARAEHIFQAVSEDLPAEFPPLRTLTGARHNLPVLPTAFFGRDDDLRALATLLDTQPLITLVGVGGAGKTRLALELAARAIDRFADGVFFADLAVLGDPDAVAGAVTSAIGIPLGPGASSRSVLLGALAAQRLLLVLDNCEHVVDGCAELAEEIVRGCPGVRVVATSREGLGVAGEQLWQVGPLPTKPGDRLPDAVALFASRAAAVRRDFTLQAEEIDTVGEICRRLDGLPLAIELAAARVAHLSVTQIADRLGDRFRLLTGSRRRADRHATLRTTIAWSVDLLDANERRLLRRLGVFAGSFTLEAVEGVCVYEGETMFALDVLGSLVDKSLVVAELDADAPRYRLLETVRLFAEEELHREGETEALRERHRDWFVQLCAPNVGVMLGVSAYRSLEPLLGNVRAAMEWSFDRGDYEAAARLVAGTWSYVLDAQLDEQFGWLRRLREHRDELPEDLAAICLTLLTLYATMSSPPDLLDIVVDATSVGGATALAWSQRAIVESTVVFTDPAFVPAVEYSVHTALDLLAGEPHPPLMRALVLSNVASALIDLSRFGEARALADEALREIDEREHSMTGMQARTLIAVASHLLGEPERALEALSPVFAALRAGVPLPETALAVFGMELAVVLAEAGEHAESQQVLRSAVAAVRRLGMPLGPADCLVGLGIVAALQQRWEDGARLLAAAVAQGQQGLFTFRTPMSGMLYLHWRERIRAALGSERARRLRAEGAALSYAEGLALGFREDPSP